MTRHLSPRADRAAMLVLAAFIALVFLTGGSARADVLSLVVLRPLAVVAAAYALMSRYDRLWRKHRGVMLFCGTCVALVAIQLVPLPPSIWTRLPDRDVVVRIDEILGFGQPWRPLSMVPAKTWNSLFSLAVPIAALALALTVGARHRRMVLYLLLSAGIVSALVGLLQAVGAGVYLYRISTVGEAAGLFANRNHQAAFLACMFPLLAILASGRGVSEREDGLLRIAAGVIGLFLVPLLLVTGSRAGLVVGAIGLAAIPLIFSPCVIASPTRRRGGDRRRFRPTPRQSIVAALAGVILLGGASILASRAESVRRLTQVDAFQSRRADVVMPVIRLAGRQVPTGAGFGTFADVYKIDEPDAVLAPTYLNQAHNDWLQVVIEGGVPGLALLAWAVVAWGRLATSALRRRSDGASRIAFARAGAAITLILGIASAFDYPLRTPALAAMFAMAFTFMLPGRSVETKDGSEDEAIIRRKPAGDVSGRVA